MQHIITFVRCLWCFLLVTGAGASYAQNPYTATPLFSSDTLIEINLECDFKTLLKNMLKDPEPEYKGKLWYRDEKGDTITLKVEIKARGNMRKKVCSFPPLRLDLPKKKVANTLFQGQNKLKLVTQCRAITRCQQWLSKEYLIYKMYNILTDYSFQVRMLKINYIDSKQQTDLFSTYAFALEPEKQLSARCEAIVIDKQGMHPKYMSRYEYGLMAVFQYMIGNTDWNEPSLHNLKLLKPIDPTKDTVIPIPYDFDYSGLINANYATPTPGVPIESVTERWYLGNCLSKETTLAVLGTFIEKKEAIYQACAAWGPLEDKDRARVMAYLDQFYRRIQNKKGEISMDILRDCRLDGDYH